MDFRNQAANQLGGNHLSANLWGSVDEVSLQRLFDYALEGGIIDLNKDRVMEDLALFQNQGQRQTQCHHAFLFPAPSMKANIAGTIGKYKNPEKVSHDPMGIHDEPRSSNEAQKRPLHAHEGPGGNGSNLEVLVGCSWPLNDGGPALYQSMPGERASNALDDTAGTDGTAGSFGDPLPCMYHGDGDAGTQGLPKNEALQACCGHHDLSIVTSRVQLQAKQAPAPPNGVQEAATRAMIKRLTETDIVIGKGGLASFWVGNKTYLVCTDKWRPEYLTLVGSKSKRSFASGKLQWLQSQGFRFVKKSDTNNGWVEVFNDSDNDLVDKLMKAMRERRRGVRRRRGGRASA